MATRSTTMTDAKQLCRAARSMARGRLFAERVALVVLAISLVAIALLFGGCA
jgi:hypothetical protein